MSDSELEIDSNFHSRSKFLLGPFLSTGEGPTFEHIEIPEISVIVVARNPANYLFRCLEALSFSSCVSLEVVVVIEEGSFKATEELLLRTGSVAVLRLPKITSYAVGFNGGSKVARGHYLIFLKDDVCVDRNAVASTLDLLRNGEDIGAVGAKLLDSERVLIEAGACLDSSGNCWSVGRGWNPDDYRVQYRRDIVFCSSAYFGICRDIFNSMQGFDESYLDEYYEDVDLCLRLNAAAKRVIYDPGSIATRYCEHRNSWKAAARLMDENRKKLLQIREVELANLDYSGELGEESFFECAKGKKILWIEDAPPFSHMGAGFPRTKEMLRVLVELGNSVTLMPTFITSSDFAEVYKDTPREVEVALGIGDSRFAEFWSTRSEFYDAVIISRPNNLKEYYRYIEDEKRKRPDLRFIYDAEAVFANRKISERRSEGSPFTELEERRLLENELSAAKSADSIFAISDHERSQLESLGFLNIHMLRHHSRIAPTPRSFNQRRDILFVGAVHSDSSPNALGLIDFIVNVLPLIRSQLGSDIKLFCAGKYHSSNLEKYASESEVFLGFVDDLDVWYDRCRLFIAPAKFAAGIPLKIIEASSRGIPVVGSELARQQLGWSQEEMLSADTAESYSNACVRVYSDEQLWDRLRNGALSRVTQDYSREHIIEAFRCALE